MAGVGWSLLAAILLCPLMATAAATPAAPSCHDRPAHDHHGDGSPAFTCCATVVTAASVKAAPEAEADAALPSAVERERHTMQHAGWHADHPRPRSAAPPLFLRHASLLI